MIKKNKAVQNNTGFGKAVRCLGLMLSSGFFVVAAGASAEAARFADRSAVDAPVAQASDAAQAQSIDDAVGVQIVTMGEQEAANGLALTDATSGVDLTLDKTSAKTGQDLPILARSDATDNLDAVNEARRLETITHIKEAPLPALRPAHLGAPKLALNPKMRSGSQFNCLAEALYFEARSESMQGQFAVAEVILNRVDSRYFPNTICGVVEQGSHRRHKCQFSYNCDGRPERITEPRAYEKSIEVAKAALSGHAPNFTDGATHYHTNYVQPSWSRKLTKTTQIGLHIFYRDPTRTARR